MLHVFYKVIQKHLILIVPYVEHALCAINLSPLHSYFYSIQSSIKLANLT